MKQNTKMPQIFKNTGMQQFSNIPIQEKALKKQRTTPRESLHCRCSPKVQRAAKLHSE